MQVSVDRVSAALFGRTVVSVREGGADGWEIVEYREREGQPSRYAALHRGERRVWGLRDQQAVARWIQRLTLPAQAELGLVPAGTA